jgi:hypothetical protein
VPVQISRLRHNDEIVFEQSRTIAHSASKSGDDSTKELIVSDVIRCNGLRVWFVAEHVVPAAADIR